MHRIPVQIHLDRETHRALADTAAVHGHTLTAVVTDLLRDAVRARAHSDTEEHEMPQQTTGPAAPAESLKAIA